MAVTAKGEILLLLHLEASDAAKHPIMYMTPPPLPPPQYTHTHAQARILWSKMLAVINLRNSVPKYVHRIFYTVNLINI